MNMTKLAEATRRVEMLYWTVLRDGEGPSCELLAIWTLLEEAATPDPDDEEAVSIIGSTEPPPPAA